ncbi:MAG: hypothetical protein JSS22_02065 [Proteobacteria bacterium]|nr:hypothetical protein [Pseudomonadota bacterium]
MAQSRPQWHSSKGEAAWLSMLVATFEKVSDPMERAIPCDPEILIAAKAHLARPACFHGLYGSQFSLRN